MTNGDATQETSARERSAPSPAAGATRDAGAPSSSSGGRTYKNLLYDVSDRIATITINRIRKFNALDAETEAEIDDAVQAAIAAPDVGAVILTGAGERTFWKRRVIAFMVCTSMPSSCQ